jgi:putative DNA methylase
MTVTRKKLIEVALPLEAINTASAREKSIRHGHPSNLHRWWARRPQAAARAVIFSQMVDDPSEYISELLADPIARRAAEKVYRNRLKTWEERNAVFEKARAAGMAGSSNPEPGTKPTLEETIATLERQRLFGIIENLVLWESTTDEAILKPAREEIWRSWSRSCADNANHPRAKDLFDPSRLPAFHDPFAGGGALPLEAQRLGMESYATDLNPVAVLVNKAMIEIPPKFAGLPSVNPEALKQKTLLAHEWHGTQGLAKDVRYYGEWICNEAEKRLGYLYPKVTITAEMANKQPELKKYIGQKLTVIAWLWARTVKSPNPAYSNIDVPLVSSFILSSKSGKEAFIEPIINATGYRFAVRMGKPKDPERIKIGTKLARANFLCLMSGVPISGDYIKEEGQAGRIGMRLMALVAEGERGRVYLSPTDEMENIALQAKAEWKPEYEISGSNQYLGVRPYGMNQFNKLFTERQLVALTTFSDLVHQARELVKRDACARGMADDSCILDAGGTGATAYADAIAVYLGLLISKTADSNNALCPWEPMAQCSRQLFGRQAYTMIWDFAEANPLAHSSGGLSTNIDVIIRSFSVLAPNGVCGTARLADAVQQYFSVDKVISTDPPYYDNVPYADLSDFFYVWLRHSLKPLLPELFATVTVPKTQELVAFAYRHKDKSAASNFFMDGMAQAMQRLAEQAHPGFPVTIYYAFKQAESDRVEGTASTGWETFLEAVIHAGFSISGTWPMRTEMTAALKDLSNSLASSIILVCRPRAANALIGTRRDFITVLKTELPYALTQLQRGNIAPVDLAQAAIGPGMAVYTRYTKVIDASGKPISVRDALAIINQILDEVLTEQEGDFDPDSRWALTWFEQSGFSEGEYGVAEILSKAKDTSVDGMVTAGILASGRGKVRLLKPAELSEDWDPTTDTRLTAWEMVHQLIRSLETGGESGASLLVAKLGGKAETARELCYRLYTLCERKKRAAEALSYNALVQSWPEIIRLARENAQSQATQSTLF